MLTTNGHLSLAQTPEVKKQPTEVEQLKQRLQQVEETVKDLKTQISAIEEAKTTPAAKIVETTYNERKSLYNNANLVRARWCLASDNGSIRSTKRLLQRLRQGRSLRLKKPRMR